ncbi:radical SAM protein [Candidatus Magnetominusculus dajiuhuensis]|uniref:radical SAM protein n=1 Tax=Candidatus Magnetominusculus dajiuhuensis TaxID=3137712 RepID=UPI003B432141
MNKILNLASTLTKYFIKSPRAGAPLRGLLYVTNRCNMQCMSCGSWQRTDNHDEMTTEAIFDVIEQMRQIGVKVIYIFGGEPTLRSDIFDIIRLCKSSNMYTEMVTNGSILHNLSKAEELVDTGLDKLCVSMDGPEAIHDKIRGRSNSFRKAIECITSVIKARDNNKRKLPLVEAACTISALNYTYIEELTELLNGLGLFEVKIRHMGVFMPMDIETMKHVMAPIDIDMPPLFSVGADILLTKENICELRPILRRIQHKYDTGLLDYVPHIEPPLYSVDDWNIGRDISGCLHLWSQICVNAKGQVIPCIWYDGINMGDCSNQGLKKAWNGEKFQYFRTHYTRLTACKKCCYFYLNFTENFMRALQIPNFPFKKLITERIKR